MTIHRARRSAILLVGLIASSLWSVSGGAQERPDRFLQRVDGIPERYVVTLDDDVAGPRGLSSRSPALARTLAARYGGTVEAVYQHAVNGFAITIPAKQAQALSRDPSVVLVEQDVLGSIATDQFNPPSWGLERIHQLRPPLQHVYTYFSTGVGSHAYVIDTGIRPTHVDFGGRASIAADFVFDGQNGHDCNGHGTHVAGTIGGTQYGVAKGVTIHALRALDCGGFGFGSQALSAVDWIAANRILPAVVNMSVNYPVFTSLDNAIRTSIANGIHYVIAAGNAGISGPNTSPQRVTEALIVGATHVSDSRASFSNFGPTLDLFAPGEDIPSLWWTSDTATAVLSGTSMAAPHVAGAVALYLESNPNAGSALVTTLIGIHSIQGVLANVGAGSPNRMLGMRALTGAAPGTRSLASLRAGSGHYLVAVNGGGGDVFANASGSPGVWGTFTLVDRNGGALNSGDAVHFYTSSWWLLSAFNAGGGVFSAVGMMPHNWENFVIEKISGSGAINSGDLVTLRTFGGRYVVAQGGGGGAVRADSTVRGSWETFTFIR